MRGGGIKVINMCTFIETSKAIREKTKYIALIKTFTFFKKLIIIAISKLGIN